MTLNVTTTHVTHYTIKENCGVPILLTPLLCRENTYMMSNEYSASSNINITVYAKKKKTPTLVHMRGANTLEIGG